MANRRNGRIYPPNLLILSACAIFALLGTPCRDAGARSWTEYPFVIPTLFPEAQGMPMAELLSRVAAELALFAGIGFLLFALNDLLVDLIYLGRAIWRGIAVRPRYPRLFADQIQVPLEPG